MGLPAKESVDMRSFKGLQTRPDPNEVEPGAGLIQVNATCVAPGELTIRPGMLQVAFEDDL